MCVCVCVYICSGYSLFLHFALMCTCVSLKLLKVYGHALQVCVCVCVYICSGYSLFLHFALMCTCVSLKLLKVYGHSALLSVRALEYVALMKVNNPETVHVHASLMFWTSDR